MKTTVKLLLALFLFIFSSEIVTGQNAPYLILKESKFQTEQYFEGNQSIRVWTSEKDKHVGKLTILNDSLIQVGSDEIKISKIIAFKSATKNRKIIGGIIGFAPVVATGVAVGVVMSSEGGFELGSVIFAAFGSVVCVVLAPIGTAIGLSKKKKIDEQRYSLSIVYR